MSPPPWSVVVPRAVVVGGWMVVLALVVGAPASAGATGGRTSKSAWETLKDWLGTPSPKGVPNGGKWPGEDGPAAPTSITWTLSAPLLAHGEPAVVAAADLSVAWGAVPGAASYTVVVRSGDGQALRDAVAVASGAPLSASLPVDLTPLQPQGCDPIPATVQITALDGGGACLSVTPPVPVSLVTAACRTQRQALWASRAEEACTRARGAERETCLAAQRTLAALNQNHVSDALQTAEQAQLSSPDGTATLADLLRAAGAPGQVPAVACPAAP